MEQNENKKKPAAIIEELPPENRSREILGVDLADEEYTDAEYTEVATDIGYTDEEYESGTEYADVEYESAAEYADAENASETDAEAVDTTYRAAQDPALAAGAGEDVQEELELASEAIEEDNLPDYEGVILSDIYEILTEAAREEPLAESYLCIGAKHDGDAVAALILEMEEETGDLTILSLYVSQAYRRLGIGTQLIHQALNIASESFVFLDGEEEELVQMKSNSLLPEDIHEVWHAFLEAVGFTDFISNPGSYALDMQELKNSKAFSPAFSNGYTPAARFVQVSELSQEEQEELAAAVMDEYSPYYSIVSGSADARETAVIIDQADIDTYRLLLADRSPVTPERDMIRAICVALHLIYADTQEFTLLVREDAGAAEPLLRQVMQKGAQMLVDEQGWMDIVFHA